MATGRNKREYLHEIGVKFPFEGAALGPDGGVQIPGQQSSQRNTQQDQRHSQHAPVGVVQAVVLTLILLPQKQQALHTATTSREPRVSNCLSVQATLMFLAS